MNSDSKKHISELNWLKEEVPKELRDRIFSAVQPELEKNKAYRPSSFISLNWIWSGVAAFAFVAIVTIKITGITDSGAPTTTFDELAVLTPEEFEIVENLDILDGIENIDIEKIRKEMKNEGKRS